jgi:hypothetical protein
MRNSNTYARDFSFVPLPTEGMVSLCSWSVRILVCLYVYVFYLKIMRPPIKSVATQINTLTTKKMLPPHFLCAYKTCPLALRK